MRNPVHPGEIIGEDVVAALGLSVSEAAKRLGVSRTYLSKVIAGTSRLNTNLAYRLELAGISTATFWLDVQTAFDLANTTVDPATVERLYSGKPGDFQRS